MITIIAIIALCIIMAVIFFCDQAHHRDDCDQEHDGDPHQRDFLLWGKRGLRAAKGEIQQKLTGAYWSPSIIIIFIANTMYLYFLDDIFICMIIQITKSINVPFSKTLLFINPINWFNSKKLKTSNQQQIDKRSWTSCILLLITSFLVSVFVFVSWNVFVHK